MFDVFAFLLEHFQNLGHLPSKVHISEKLNEAGFDHEEIANFIKCFDYLFNEDNQNHQLNYSNLSSKMRVFSAEEMVSIPKDIRGYLYFLYQKEAIGFANIEKMIHAIMKIDPDELNLDTVKAMTLITAWVNKSEIQILIGDDLIRSLCDNHVIH